MLDDGSGKLPYHPQIVPPNGNEPAGGTTSLAALEAENRALREAGDWLFTALNLAQAENTMCLDHFREAEMTAWVQGLMTVRGKSQAALDQWTAIKATLAPKEGK